MILICFISLLLLCSRGLLELIFEKNLAYFIQFVLMISMMFILRQKSNIRNQSSINLVLILLYSIISLVSAFITTLMTNFYESFIYAFINIFLIFYIYENSLSNFDYIKKYKILSSLKYISIILLSVSVLQQYEILSLPGDNYFNVVRPSSLTGSYLHYPIIIAILAIIFMQGYLNLKKIHFLYLSIALTIGVILSYSRSGMLIILISYLYFLFILNKKYFIVAILLFSVILFGEYDGLYSERISSMFSPNSPGNVERISIWAEAFKLFSDGYFFIGNQTGFFTNITKNLVHSDSTVLESTALQQIINFGIFGFVIFYYFLFFVYRKIENKCILLKGLALSCIAQSFIYQSGEVIPFIYFYSLLPGLSKSIMFDTRQIT